VHRACYTTAFPQGENTRLCVSESLAAELERLNPVTYAFGSSLLKDQVVISNIDSYMYFSMVSRIVLLKNVALIGEH